MKNVMQTGKLSSCVIHFRIMKEYNTSMYVYVYTAGQERKLGIFNIKLYSTMPNGASTKSVLLPVSQVATIKFQ